jgi:hypothetical protein
MNNLTITVIGASAPTKTIEEVGCEIVASLKAAGYSCIHLVKCRFGESN